MIIQMGFPCPFRSVLIDSITFVFSKIYIHHFKELYFIALKHDSESRIGFLGKNQSH